MFLGYDQLLKQVLFQIDRMWGQHGRAHQEKYTLYMGSWTCWSLWWYQKNYQCPHTQILWPQNFSHSSNRCQLEMSWLSTPLQRLPMYMLPVDISSLTKKYMLQLTMDLMHLLRPWRNSSTYYMVKGFNLKQTKCHLKMCSQESDTSHTKAPAPINGNPTIWIQCQVYYSFN